MTKNAAPKLAERSIRLLKLLLQNQPSIERTASDTCLVLNFEGLRQIKCDRKIFAGWVSADLVKVSIKGSDGQYLSLTHQGEKFLREQQEADPADRHRANVSILIKNGDEYERKTVNARESPLASLYFSKQRGSAWLADAEFQAGERLRSDFEFSQMAPRVTASWDPTATLSSKGGRRPDADINERAMGARQRLNKAIEAVGPELSGVLLDVCCFLKGVEQVERERQWPRRSAKLILKAALSALSRHYNPKTKSKVNLEMRHWGTSDFRPQI